MRIEAEFEAEEGEWIKRTAKQRGISVSQFFRDLALEYRLQSELSGKVASRKKPPTAREKLLAKIRENNSEIRSAVDLKIPLTELEKWREDPAYQKELGAARAYWIDGLQEEMRLIGCGKKKGDANALSRLLAAHHLAFGRAKVELVLRLVDPLVKKLIAFLRLELGASAEEGIKKALDRFNRERRKRFSDLT